jgi:alkyl hydroperoxide reductase subunit F
MYELVIIGGGPAAISAGVYAGRKQIKTALITESFGGQSIVSNEIYNWIGTKAISGLQLAQDLESHLKTQAIDIVEGERVSAVTLESGGPPSGHFVVTTSSGKTFETKTILVASGSRRRRLGIPGEDRLDGKGVVFCSTCDAPLFKNKEVVVVGAGNAGLEAIVDSIPYASKITLLVRGTELRGDAITQEKVKTHPKVTILYNSVTKEVVGEKYVTGVRYQDVVSGEVKELPADGLFVEIGSVPNSDFVKELVECNKIGEIIVDHKTQAASRPGIWASGDVSDVLYKQNNISAGDAIKALLNIYDFLHKNHLTSAHKSQG